MNNIWKNIGLPITLVIIAALSYSCYKLYEMKEGYKSLAKQLKESVNIIGSYSNNTTNVSTDIGDLNVTSAEPATVTPDNIKVLSSTEKPVLDALGIKAKDIDEFSHMHTETIDSVTAEAKRDTLGTINIDYHDDYANISVIVRKDSDAQIKYCMQDSIVVTKWRKRHSILFGLIKWSGKSRIDVYSKNPKTVIKSVEIIQRSDPP